MSDMSRPWRWRFSLRWMLIAVTLLAVALAIGVYGMLSVLFGFVLRGLLPTMAAICAIYARGDVRAFAVGAFTALVPVLVGGTGSVHFTSLLGTTVSQLLAIGLCGAVAVATRRWLISQGKTDENQVQK